MSVYVPSRHSKALAGRKVWLFYSHVTPPGRTPWQRSKCVCMYVHHVCAAYEWMYIPSRYVCKRSTGRCKGISDLAGTRLHCVLPPSACPPSSNICPHIPPLPFAPIIALLVGWRIHTVVLRTYICMNTNPLDPRRIRFSADAKGGLVDEIGQGKRRGGPTATKPSTSRTMLPPPSLIRIQAYTHCTQRVPVQRSDMVFPRAHTRRVLRAI